MTAENLVRSLSTFEIHTLQTRLEQAYLDEGSGPALVFLHGFPDHAGSWDDVIAELSKSFRCIAPFLRGYFPTETAPDGDYRLATVAADVHALMEQLDIKSYRIVGQDWGAAIGYLMANAYPDNITGLVALALPHSAYIKLNLSTLIKARHIFYLGNPKKAVKRFQKNQFSYLNTLMHRWAPNLPDLKTHINTMRACFELPGRSAAALAYYWDMRKKSGRLKSGRSYTDLPACRTLVIAGEQDGAIGLKPFKQMANHAAFEVRFSKHAGHFIQREDPNAVIEAVLSLTKNVL